MEYLGHLAVLPDLALRGPDWAFRELAYSDLGRLRRERGFYREGVRRERVHREGVRREGVRHHREGVRHHREVRHHQG